MQMLMLILFAAVVGLGIGFVAGRVLEIRRNDERTASRYSTRSLGEPPTVVLTARVTSSLRDGSQL
jgi:hypothetical protein